MPNKKTINLPFDVYQWECESGHEFAVILLIGDQSWSHNGNPNYPPYCPVCGKQVPKGVKK